MDDVMVRSRYPRRSVPAGRRKRNTGTKKGLAKIIARQTAVCLILLLAAGIIRLVDSPVTNYMNERIHYVLGQNIEMSSIYKYIENAAGSLRSSIFPADQAAGSQPTNGQASSSQPTNGQASGSQPTNGGTSQGALSVASASELSQETSVLAANTEEGTIPDPFMIAPVAGTISSFFGERIDPNSKIVKKHEGIDIAASRGAGIVAVLGGEVVETGASPTYGNYIKIRHNEIYTTVYAHCSSLVLKQGQKVNKGDVIAKVGDSGAAVGVHLHFEIWKDGKPVNPLDYIKIPAE
jgi:murein DD-endopeptidase MepM/ murein hydrolase activator NlpD